jgi:protease IV
MQFNHTLSAILRGHWMLDRQWAEAHLPLVLLMLQGKTVSFVERTGNAGVEQPFVVDPSTMQRYNWMDGRNANIPENSVGVIPISGPITKYNGDCGEPGAIQRNTWMLQMQKRQNVGSIVQLLDTPGGEARAAASSMDIIKSSKKPVLSFVDGMSASLGMWYTSASRETYLSSKSDEMGSVGSYLTLLDVRGYFEQQGIKIHEIYAPQSEDKNKDYREALKGNYEGYQQDLKKHVDEFISFIKDERPKAAATEAQWNSGKMFYAQDAIKLGLADGIRSFDQVVSKAAWLAKRNK